LIEIDRALLTWIKSSRSNAGNCVEMALAGEVVLLRDSKDPDGPLLQFTMDAWRAFLLDLPARPDA